MSVDKAVWRHSASIKSSVLIHGKEDDVVMQFPDQNTEIKLSVPEPIADQRWPGWETIIRSAWLYKVSIDFLATREDVVIQARQNLDKLVSIISFLTSSPVQVGGYGSIITPASEGTPGQTYSQIIIGVQEGHLDPRELEISRAGIETQLMPMFISEALTGENGNQILRSLRWLQHSYQALTPVDEFICLIFSLEGIATLLGQGNPLYWRCERCNTQFQECPNCCGSTVRASSGSALIRDFLKLYAGWSGKRWNEMWSLRSKIAHGDQGLSKSEERTIIASLSDLEFAVNKALRSVLKMSDEAAPYGVRFRPPLGVDRMEIEWSDPKAEKE